MPHTEVEAMISTQAAAGDGNLLPTAETAHQGEDLVKDVVFIGNVAADPVMRMEVPVVPTFRIDAIDTEDLELSGIDFSGDCANHAGILVLEKAAARGWKDQKRHSGMPEGEKLHVVAEAWAEPIVVIAAHGV